MTLHSPLRCSFPFVCLSCSLVFCAFTGEVSLATPSIKETTRIPATKTPATRTSVTNSKSSQSNQSQDSQISVMDFPSKPIGKLYALSKTWKPERKRNDEKFLAVAKGRVTAPSDTPLSLKLDYSLTADPQSLVVPPSNIVQISGDGIEFEDNICEPISKVPSVIRVDLSSSEVTDAGVEQLCKMKQLRSLALAKSMIKGSCLRAMSACDLVYFDISQNAIDQQYYKYFANFAHVVKARVNNDALTDESLKFIGSMKSLRDLELRGNLKITNDGLRYLFPLKTLQFLTIRDSKIGVSGVELILTNMKLKLFTVDDKILDNPAGKRLLAKYAQVLNAYPEKGAPDVDTLYAPLK